jgi:ubiquinone/menaquinone biosynthesis C-methylase UbiE
MSAKDDFIDVATLIAAYDAAEHARRADAYFASMQDPTPILRKPFASFPEAQEILPGLGALLRTLDLFPGCRVLDFGCGTGWLAKALLHLGCEVVAVDVSAAALQIAKTATSRDPLAAGAVVEWLVFDGMSIPLPDRSIDRLICFDAFHHVADQRAVLVEMQRVLVPGGLAGFHEPGPRHSTSPQAQAEMRAFGVIENDIHIGEIEKLARAAGFANTALLTYSRLPQTLSAADYERLSEMLGTPQEYEELGRSLMRELTDVRAFVLTNAGAMVRDSRNVDGLSGRLEMVENRSTQHVLDLHLRVVNDGARTWLPSGPRRGAVNIGVHLIDEAGQETYSWGRIAIASHALASGDSVEVTARLDLPRSCTRARLELVTELVAWFTTIGGEPLVVELC